MESEASIELKINCVRHYLYDIVEKMLHRHLVTTSNVHGHVMRLTNSTVGSNLKGHAEKGKEKAEFHNNDKRLSCMNVDYGQSVVFAKTFDPALPEM